MSSDSLHRWLEAAWIGSEVGTLQPKYRAVLLAADGLRPGPSDHTSEPILAAAEQIARDRLQRTPLETLPHIQQWREAFRGFGAKPNRTRPSVESLLRRLDRGLPRIDRLTDLYNAVSIRHLVPVGGEDLQQYVGPLRLTRASGGENFDTTAGGRPVVEYADPGEVIWRDDIGATCRRWNWRQGTRTRITDRTTRAVFILDALPALGITELHDAADHLRQLLRQINPGATIVARLSVPRANPVPPSAPVSGA
jgi:DNA/RNA-binding domain of Phe-tRNA-synthetase-like protein